MYLAFVAVYMLTTLNIRVYDYFKKPPTIEYYNPRFDNYTDIDNNVLPDMNYCESKTCFIKCCGFRQYLDDDGECQDEVYFRDICIDLGFSNRTCAGILREMDHTNSRFMESYHFIWRENQPVGFKRHYSPEESYLLRDGTLNFRWNDTSPFIEIYPLRFCLDYRFDFLSEYEKFKMVYDLTDVHKYKTTEIDLKEFLIIYVNWLGGALLFTFVSILVIVLMYRKSLCQRYTSFILGVYYLSIICAYVLKVIEVMRLIDGEVEEDACRYFGPFFYFLLISAFCWSLTFMYDFFVTTRIFRRTGTKVVSANIVTFVRYCVFSWGLPLMLTISAIAGARLDLVLLKPPFDSCFENENQTMFYLHVPISMLIISYGVIFILHTYEMWLLHWALQNTRQIKDRLNISSRFYAFRILFNLLVFFVTFGFIPDVPLLLYYVIRTSIVITGVILFCLFVFTNTSNEELKIDWNLLKTKCQVLGQDNSTIKPLNDGIAIISNNNLDKKKNLTFSYNLDLVKDEFMSKLLPEKMTDFIKNHSGKGEERMPIINNMDIENGGNDIINDEPANAENSKSNEALESCETKINEDLKKINESMKIEKC